MTQKGRTPFFVITLLFFVIASGAKQSRSHTIPDSSSSMRAQPAIGDLMPVFKRSPTLREAQVEDDEKGVFKNGVMGVSIK